MSTLSEAKKHYAKVLAIYNATKNSIKQSPEVIAFQREAIIAAQGQLFTVNYKEFIKNLSSQIK